MGEKVNQHNYDEEKSAALNHAPRASAWLYLWQKVKRDHPALIGWMENLKQP